MLLMMLAVIVTTEKTSAAVITIDRTQMDITPAEAPKKPLTKKTMELQGTEAARDFYYTLTEDVKDDGNYNVTFHLRHSELLIAPSSFTVKIDDSAVKTIPLTTDNLRQTVTIPFTQDALKKGTHKITASFYGIVKEGACVAPGNAGSWLRIDPLSSMSLFEKGEEGWTLGDYPNAFLSYEGYETTIIIPQKASLTTWNSAYKMAAYLSEHGDKNARIVKETAAQKVKGAVVILGAKSDFETATIKNVMKRMTSMEENAMSVGVYALKNTDSKQMVPALVMTAQKDEDIASRIALLTNERLYSQLAGETFTAHALPTFEETIVSNMSFEEFGFTSQTLSSQVAKTPMYYVSLPYLQADKEASLQLLLKKSATLQEDGKDTSPKAELIVYINDVPHAVDLRKLQSAAGDMYEVALPVATNTLNKNKLTTMQFEVTGFQLQAPCEDTDERYWLYIDGKSKLSVPNDKVEPSYTFKDFPRAFYKNTMIVLPKDSKPYPQQMLDLYKSLMMNGKLAYTEVVTEDKVTEEELGKHAVIFVGQREDFALLKDYETSIMNSDEDFLAQGILVEAVQDSAFISRSFWSEQQPFLLVDMNSDNKISASLTSQLREINEDVQLAILTKEGQLVTAEQKKIAEEDVTTTVEDNKLSSIIIPLVFFIALIVIALLFVLRRRKKGRIEEE